MKSMLIKITAIALITTLLFSCKKDDPLAGTFTSAKASFGSGKAWVYVQNDNDGNPLEVGVTMDEAAFNAFDANFNDLSIAMDYPKEAERTPFKHQFIGWNSNGHEPTGIYDLPHFDLHYYAMASAARDAISVFDTIKAANMPMADFFPTAYFPTGLVPTMGVHWNDGTSPELNGTKFTETFIYGSFDGKVTFMEPMITKEFIAANASFEKAIRQPAKYQTAGLFYPTKQGFTHDTGNKEYRFFLSSFVKH
jgi:hypothetical protein